MPELQDLFVSYKSLQPNEPYKPDDEEKDILEARAAARSRIQQIAERNQLLGEEEDAEPTTQDDEGQVEEWMSDLNDQPAEFQWFTTQLRSAWKEAATPETVRQNQPVSATPRVQFTGTVTKYNRGNLDKEIQELFQKAGINIRVTSGKRKAGAVGKAGNRSHHVHGNACDIVPGQGETFDSIRRKMKDHPEILQFFYENGLGVIDETIPANMARTGATGPHFHIGPDQWAVRTWSEWTGNKGKPATNPYAGGSTDKRQEWTRNTYNAFVQGLKDEYGTKYNNATYKKIASYMTYQAALESGYGQHANGFNYSGHMKNGETIYYGTMDEFVKAHIKTLKKWDFMKANSLKEYIDSLYVGPYIYNPSQTPSEYLAVINGTTSRVNRYLGMSARFGGKFANIRQLHEQSFSQYRR